MDDGIVPLSWLLLNPLHREGLRLSAEGDCKPVVHTQLFQPRQSAQGCWKGAGQQVVAEITAWDVERLSTDG